MLSRVKQVLLAATGVAALALGGSALAGAASTSTSATAPTTAPSGPPEGAAPSAPPEGAGQGFPAGEAPGTAKHEGSESAVTGADASKAQAAAVKSVGGTAGPVTSNFTRNGYEITVTKSDGAKVTVHVDSAFQVEQGGGTH
ncbi:MAG: hypothetical protein WCB67_04355 [Solirubrobacteraceae bacterium]